MNNDLKRQLKGRKLEDIINSANEHCATCDGWEAEFLADPERFAAEHGLLPGEAGRLRRWLAKDPCHLCFRRRPVCPYPRLCAAHRKADNDRQAYWDEMRRLTSGLQSATSFVQDGILDAGVVVLEQGGSELREYRSAITAGRAYIEISDGSDTTYTTLYADAETIAAAVQAGREYAERIRAEWEAQRASLARYRVRV